jgi:hypothetical protein
VARWEGAMDADKLKHAMEHPIALGEQIETTPIQA